LILSRATSGSSNTVMLSDDDIGHPTIEVLIMAWVLFTKYIHDFIPI